MLVKGADPRALREIPRVPAIRLTRLGVGGAPIGGFPEDVPRDEAIAMLAAARRAGMNWVDSAVLYGAGKSLRLIGEALGSLGDPDTIVTTKVGRRPVPAPRKKKKLDIYTSPDPFNLVYDYSKDGVRAAIDFSLARLKRSRIDLVFVHDPDAEGMPRLRQVLDVTLPALAELKAKGVIGAIGLGMNQWEWPMVCMKERAPIDVILCAGCYNIAEQGALELFGPCVEAGIALLNGGVYGSGLIASSAKKRATYRYHRPSPEMRRKVARFWDLCERHGVSRHAAALQFAAAPEAVTAIPLGAVSAAQVAENMAAMEAPIPAAFWRELRTVMSLPVAAPLPGGN